MSKEQPKNLLPHSVYEVHILDATGKTHKLKVCEHSLKGQMWEFITPQETFVVFPIHNLIGLYFSAEYTELLKNRKQQEEANEKTVD